MGKFIENAEKTGKALGPWFDIGGAILGAGGSALDYLAQKEQMEKEEEWRKKQFEAQQAQQNIENMNMRSQMGMNSLNWMDKSIADARQQFPPSFKQAVSNAVRSGGK